VGREVAVTTNSTEVLQSEHDSDVCRVAQLFALVNSCMNPRRYGERLVATAQTTDSYRLRVGAAPKAHASALR
jgi:hypothetical protein